MLDSLSIGALASPFLTGGASTLIAILVLIVLMYIVTAIIGKPLSMGIGPIKLNFPGRNGKHKNKKDKPNNDRSKKTYEFFAKEIKTAISEHEGEIVELKYDTLRRQLNFAEEKLGDIKSIMSATYTELLKNKLDDDKKDGVKSHSEYKTYQMIMRIALNECVLKVLKRAFKSNHLDEMNEVEWKDYIEHKTDLGINSISEFLDIMYGDYFKVTRQELSDGNDQHIDEVKVEIKDIFENAKKIQIKNNAKINDIRSEIDVIIKGIIDDKHENGGNS